ncbi:MAG: hypothetical protein HY827_04565 [Actinobacteria bacterium]|nr:hypothetical protein [Actinomycetota bacterium]
MIALVAVSMLVAFSALAAASKAKHRKHVVVHHPQNGASVGRLIRALGSKNPLHALNRLHKTSIPARYRTAARRGTSPAPAVPVPTTGPPASTGPDTNATRVLAAATDWPNSYALLLKRRIQSIDDEFDSALPIQLVRRNAQTGERTVLMRMRRAFPYAVRAGGGRVLVALLDSKSSRSVKTRIVAFDVGSTSPVEIASDNITATFDEDDDDACGRMAMLNDAGPTGEAIVTRLTGICSADGQRDFDIETIAIARDGATRMLDPTPTETMLTLGRAQLSGNYLLTYGPFVKSFNVLDLSVGSKTRVWDVESTNNASIANDGTVVVGPGLTVDDDGDYNPYFFFAGHNEPIVTFSPGDADNPSAIADAGYKSVVMRHCADKLYELRMPRFIYQDSTASTISVIDGLPVVSALQVVVRNSGGGEARQIAVTDRVWVRSLGCDGDALVLTTDNGSSVNAQRFAP